MSEPPSPPPPPGPGTQSPPAPAAGAAPDAAEGPPPSPPPGANRNLMIALAYLGPMALIPLLAAKEDSEVQWHAKHGLVLLVAEILAAAVWIIAQAFASAVFAPMGCIFFLVGLGLFLGVAIFHIMAIVRGIQGSRLTIPGLSELTERF